MPRESLPAALVAPLLWSCITRLGVPASRARLWPRRVVGCTVREAARRHRPRVRVSGTVRVSKARACGASRVPKPSSGIHALPCAKIRGGSGVVLQDHLLNLCSPLIEGLTSSRSRTLTVETRVIDAPRRNCGRAGQTITWHQARARGNDGQSIWVHE